jgi:hypothetical protein
MYPRIPWKLVADPLGLAEQKLAATVLELIIFLFIAVKNYNS